MTAMVDLHMHTTLSDGALCPAELIRRAEVAGVKLMAITDHVDAATVETIVPQLVKAARVENRLGRVLVVPGAELTHVRPEHIGEVVAAARACGALWVTCHGETLAEPVIEGTNRAAIDAGVNALAHPGLIAEADVKRAASANVALEVTSKRGHCYTNGHVVRLALEHGATLVYGSDSHEPGQIKSLQEALAIIRGAGLDEKGAQRILDESERLLRAADAANDAKDEPV
jgi:putative hydrolase